MCIIYVHIHCIYMCIIDYPRKDLHGWLDKIVVWNEYMLMRLTFLIAYCICDGILRYLAEGGGGELTFFIFVHIIFIDNSLQAIMGLLMEELHWTVTHVHYITVAKMAIALRISLILWTDMCVIIILLWTIWCMLTCGV